MTSSDPSAEILGRLDGIERHLGRLETALIGDVAVGHKGIVARLETLEIVNVESPNVHQGIEDRAADGRSKIHERIDELEEHTNQRISQLFDQWNRVKYTAAGIGVGIGLVSGVSAAWISNLFGS